MPYRFTGLPRSFLLALLGATFLSACPWDSPDTPHCYRSKLKWSKKSPRGFSAAQLAERSKSERVFEDYDLTTILEARSATLEDTPQRYAQYELTVDIDPIPDSAHYLYGRKCPTRGVEVLAQVSLRTKHLGLDETFKAKLFSSDNQTITLSAELPRFGDVDPAKLKAEPKVCPEESETTENTNEDVEATKEPGEDSSEDDYPEQEEESRVPIHFTFRAYLRVDKDELEGYVRAIYEEKSTQCAIDPIPAKRMLAFPRDKDEAEP